MGNDNAIAVVAITIIAAGLLTGWNYSTSGALDCRDSAAALADRVDKLDFPISCTPDGRLVIAINGTA